MYTLLIIFILTFVYAMLFGKITVNGYPKNEFSLRFYGSFIASIIMTLILGLPILGVMRLLGI